MGRVGRGIDNVSLWLRSRDVWVGGLQVYHREIDWVDGMHIHVHEVDNVVWEINWAGVCL